MKTIEDCDIELMKVDNELARLNLERRHLLELRELLLREPKPRARTEREKAILMSEKQRLVGIVKDNPGINGNGIFAIYGEENHRKITFWLSDLRRQGYLENRGGRGPSARWYAIEEESK